MVLVQKIVVTLAGISLADGILSALQRTRRTWYWSLLKDQSIANTSQSY